MSGDNGCPSGQGRSRAGSTAPGERLASRGMIADALVVGGAATALANDPNHATRDADARFVPHSPREPTPPGIRLAIGGVPG